MPRGITDKIKGREPEQQVQILAKALDQIQPKLRKTISFGSPLVVVNGSLASGVGEVVSNLIVLPGRLLGGAVFIRRRKGAVRLTVTLASDEGSKSTEFNITRRLTSVVEDQAVKPGTILMISVDADEPDELAGVMVTIVMEVKVSRQAMTEFVIDDLANLETEATEAPTTAAPTTSGV